MPASVTEGAPEALARPLARSRLRVWVPGADGRYAAAQAQSGPEILGRASASALTGLAPGTLVQDPAGALYGVAADGTTYELGDASEVADAQADATTAIADAAAAQVDATAAIADAAAAQVDATAALLRYENGATDWANLANGTTNGKLKTQAPVSYRIGGQLYGLGFADNLFDLSAEVNTTVGQYRAYWLYADSLMVASIAAGANAASSAAAKAALPAVSTTKSVIGVYVAGPSCDFDGAAGLAAQGTIINGWPTSAQ